MIEARDLGCTFGTRRALDSVSFTVEEGEVVGLLGPNGAGKTTCLRLLCGLLAPDHGQVRVGGLDMQTQGFQARGLVGYLAEGAPLPPDLRTEEVLRWRGRLRGLSGPRLKDELERVLGLLELGAVRRRLVGELSRGFRQRLGLAEALVGDPPVLLLDEPTVGLDPNQIRDLRGFIRRMGGQRTLLLSSHQLSEIQAMCSRVLILSGGRLVGQGTLEELVARMASEALVVRVRGGSEEAVRACLSAVPGVEEVRPVEPGPGDAPEASGPSELATVEAGDGVHGFRLRVKPGVRVREALAIAVLERGFGLIELASEPLVLERLFAHLTREEP